MSPDKKKFWMWFCVGSITAVIAVVWIASIRYNISISIVDVARSKQKGAEALTGFGDNFKKQLEDINIILNTTTSSAATSTE